MYKIIIYLISFQHFQRFSNNIIVNFMQFRKKNYIVLNIEVLKNLLSEGFHIVGSFGKIS